MLLRTLKYPLIITVIALVATLLFAGINTALIVAILAILEISLSFDNAVVNAKILGKMSDYWQKIFLTVGIAIAVFGMRLVFPILVVTIAAHLGPLSVLTMALHDPGQYADHLRAAHASIAAFGGMFLLMIFLDFVFEDREIKWLVPIESFLAKLGKLDYLSVIVALTTLGVAALTFAKPHANEVLIAGIFGIVTYLAVGGLSSLFEADQKEVTQAVGKAGFFTFLYLEVLDASFSFDGVTGAFAISDQVLVIALGLGIGALYIRSLTVYLVRTGKLAEYRYLEHGAHWAIGALAILLMVGITHEIPEVITGLIGVAFIAAAFGHSLLALRRDRVSTTNTRHTNAEVR
jgi:hypothetical protein